MPFKRAFTPNPKDRESITSIQWGKMKKYSDKINMFLYMFILYENNNIEHENLRKKMNINLNWKLILAHHRVYEYVIVHELCHIGCWNHSQQFWNRVASILPDYQTRKNELKRISEFLSAFNFSKLSDGN